MMKQRSLNMSAVLLLGAGGILYANDVSRSFLAIRPYAGHVMNHYQLLDQAYDNGRVLKMNSAQVSFFGGSSFCADALARYFMFNGKSRLSVKNIQEAAVVVVNGQDILAGHFNFDPNGDTGYRGTISFAPKQSFIGASLSFKGHLPHHMWLALELPVVYVKNDMHLDELIDSPDSAEESGTWLDKEKPVRTMKDAFKRSGMRYGKIDGARHSTGLADVTVKIGHDPVLLNRKDLHISYNTGFVMPTSNKAKAIYVFEPIRGNGGHWALLGGCTAEMLLKSMEHGHVWAQHRAEIQYLFHNTQRRSLDFIINGAWSRYLSLFPDENARASDIAANTSRVSGINLMTRDVSVTPGFQASFESTLSYIGNKYHGTFGWTLSALQGESICLKKPWELGPQIADLATNNQVTPYARIGSETYGSSTDTARFIQEFDIDLNSAARPAVLTNMIQAKVGRYWQKEHPVLFEVGSSVEVSTFNTALNRWSIWGTFNVAF